jgi:hypothetical protein
MIACQTSLYYGMNARTRRKPSNIHLEVLMKRLVIVLALLIAGSTALSLAQDKNILSTYNIFPKPGKDEAVKKAIAAHAAKYHSGSWKWRVFSVLSGSNEGSYLIVEGPNSWTELEGRKDISAEHTKDYETNVLPLLEKSTPGVYVTYHGEFSSGAVVTPFKKALLRHIYPKPGKGARVLGLLPAWKKVWEKLGLNTAIFTTFFSGEPQLILSARLPNGFIDLEHPMGKKMRETYDEIEGPGAYDRFLEDLDQSVSKVDEEIIEYMPDMSAK